jgi:serine/threonine protein kinase
MSVLSRPHDDDSLPPVDLAHVIAVCDRFEADLNGGRSRRIEDELEAVAESSRERLFRELVLLELELARRAGRPASLDSYLARFPDRAAVVRQVFANLTNTRTDPDATDATEGPSAPAASGEGYELIRALGKGGQATTYLARDLALHRLVVLKRYHAVDSGSRRDAVLSEGRALARVRSPYVAPCYGVKIENDEIDLIEEYIPGRTLKDWTAAERADFRLCSRLVAQVAEGLAEVHACGLLHRDIKPQNIILGDDGLPRLVDFGLAVPLASEALHGLAGSPPYMAPEQARGQGERVDIRTDVYGLGAVLYYLVTGQPPHEGKTVGETIGRARDASVLPARRINPRVPRAIERVCLKAMAADPKLRFQSAGEVGHAMRRYLLFRRAVPIVGAAAILLILIETVVAVWPKATRPRQADSIAAVAEPANGRKQPESERPTTAALRVTHFEILHFAKLEGQEKLDNTRSGVLGRTSFATREDDDLKLDAELSEPAYSYLIAFRPDGTDELCDPDDEDAPPLKKRQPVYPPPSKSDDRYRLSEGAGLCAFALVVSRQSLPPYREWKRRVGQMAWSARLPCEAGVVWRDEGQGLEPLRADDAGLTRGKGAKARDFGGPAAKLATWLRGLPGVDVVTLVAFPVEPADKR